MSLPLTRRPAFVMAALLAALALPAAHAAPEAGGARQQMKKLDTDGDRHISREEAKAAPKLAEAFDQIDTDKDGKLSADELKAWGQDKAEDAFEGLDSNHDGALDKSELAGRPRLLKHFDALDANKDGKLSREEFKAAASRR